MKTGTIKSNSSPAVSLSSRKRLVMSKSPNWISGLLGENPGLCHLTRHFHNKQTPDTPTTMIKAYKSCYNVLKYSALLQGWFRAYGIIWFVSVTTGHRMVGTEFHWPRACCGSLNQGGVWGWDSAVVWGTVCGLKSSKYQRDSDLLLSYMLWKHVEWCGKDGH